MMKDVETEKEFFVSKALLMFYLHSSEIRALIQPQEIQRLMDFLRQHVCPHETSFARCYFLDVRGFDAYSNTPLEGTNRGLKYCENAVRPDMYTAQATKFILNQDAKRIHEKRLLVSNMHHKSQLYTNTKTGQDIQKKAESMLQSEMEESKHYISVWVNEKLWWVLRAQQRNRREKKSQFLSESARSS